MNNEKRPMAELRAVALVSGTEKPVIEGYLAKFNSPTNFMGVPEVIKPGAFSDLINEVNGGKRNIVLLRNHDRDKVLARTDNDTLSLAQDNVGLFFRAFPPNVTWANETVEEIRSGHINGGSFGFIERESDIRVVNGIRQMTQLAVDEVTITGMPAYQDTDVTIAKRMMADYNDTQDRMNKLAARILLSRVNKEV